jgi:hypothetical protein
VDESGAFIQGNPVALCEAVADLLARVRRVVPFWEDDGVLYPVLEAVGTLVRSGALLDENSPPPW